MIERTLWDGQAIPALGLGCWAIGGTWTAGGQPAGWGEVDDTESIRAVHAAIEAGIRFFDTAQAYGAGHSERVLGEALKGRPSVRVATKVGLAIDEDKRLVTGADIGAAAIRASIDASLKRLQRERVDLVLLHLNSLSIAEAEPVFELLGGLREAGKIGAFGWSTDYPDRAAAFAGQPGMVAVEHAMNVFFRAEALLPVIEAHGLLSINRSPLAMGLLGGKYTAESLIGPKDVRGSNQDWLAYFKDGKVAPEYVRSLHAVRDLLQTGGRSLAQGAIGWLWARSDSALPIPGFRTAVQVMDLTGALAKGPLPGSVMDEIEAVIQREPEGAPRDR